MVLFITDVCTKRYKVSTEFYNGGNELYKGLYQAFIRK